MRIDKENKFWLNPSIPFKLGCKLLNKESKKILIQNPENLWTENLFEFLEHNLNDQAYISFPCFSLDQFHSNSIDLIKNMTYEELCDEVFNKSGYSEKEGESCWYNHSIYAKKYFHFAGAITRGNLNKLGGLPFNNELAYGIGWDDNFFVSQVSKLGIDMIIPERPVVLHQYHYQSGQFKNHPNVHNLYNKNAELFYKTINEKLPTEGDTNNMFKSKLICDQPTESGNTIKAGTLCDKCFDILPDFINGQENMAKFLTPDGILFTTSCHNVI